jgi:1,4-dihydroxy-2-naphthoate octaprenyltransferase
MDEFWAAFTQALFFVCLLSMCFTIGYILKTLQRMLQAQKFILDHQLAISQAIDQGSLTHQMLSANNWRDLPPEARRMMRNTLVDIVREMDAEMSVWH